MDKQLETVYAELVKLAAKAGAESALEKIRCEKEKEQKRREDKRKRNTKLLLQHYREFKEYARNAIYSAEQSEDVVDILDLMWSRNNRGEQIVESIKKSAIRTKIIMTHIDGMLGVYETLSNGSGNKVEQRRYKALYDYYIAEERKSIEDIAGENFIDARQVYYDLDFAVDKMGKLIFGIDGLLDK